MPTSTSRAITEQLQKLYSIGPIKSIDLIYPKGLVTYSHFIKKEALAQVFSCEFCEISKNTFFH